MRISDWSSDVCSSDLLRDYGRLPLREVIAPAIGYARDGFAVVPMMNTVVGGVAELFRTAWPTSAEAWLVDGAAPQVRSEERRVGNEWFSTFRSRWSPYL